MKEAQNSFKLNLKILLFQKKNQFGSLKRNRNVFMTAKFCYLKPDLSSGLLTITSTNLTLISFLPTSPSTC